MWYPENKQELQDFIEKSFNQKLQTKSREDTSKKPLGVVDKKIPKKINGLIVPHAGYEYSGAIAGKAFSLLKDKKLQKAVVVGPSHYVYLYEACTSNLKEWKTPLGQIKLFNKNFQQGDIESEHSIKNQIPFLQKLGAKEIMPLMIGKITGRQASDIAKKITKIKNCTYIFSTDLSHFYDYEKAVKTDKNTIKILENLDLKNFDSIDACGIYPLLVLFHLCKIKKTHPRLIEYKNSGDITGDKSGVVGYSTMWF